MDMIVAFIIMLISIAGMVTAMHWIWVVLLVLSLFWIFVRIGGGNLIGDFFLAIFIFFD